MPHNLLKRYGHWALITGASSGIGRQFAHALAAEGINLVVLARRIHLLHELRDELTRQHHIDIKCLQIDLTHDDAHRDVQRGCNGIDIGLIIHNAGFGIPGRFADADVHAEKNLIHLNCIAPMEITRAMLPGMLARRKGAIIFVSSLMGFQGVPYMANYSATKGYLLNFGESLHHECKESGIDVLVLAPGATDTPGKDHHDVDYSRLPITWMTAPQVVDAALRSLGKKVFMVPGLRNRLTACLTSGLWSRSHIQRIMKRLAKSALPTPQ